MNEWMSKNDLIIENNWTTSALKNGNFPKIKIHKHTPAAHKSDIYAE